MEIITRQEAIKRGLPKYFTGEPCKNGHIAQRYLQSSTCELCIRAACGAPLTPELLEMRQKRANLAQQKLSLSERRVSLAEERIRLEAERREGRLKRSRLLAQLTPIRVLLHYEDLEFFKAYMLASAMATDATIALDDLLSRRAAEIKGDRGIYTFRCFPSSFTALRQMESDLETKRAAGGTDRERLQYAAEMKRRAADDARKIAAESELPPNISA